MEEGFLLPFYLPPCPLLNGATCATLLRYQQTALKTERRISHTWR